MRQVSQEQNLDNTLDFTKEQKLKLMQFVTSDPHFLERCDIIYKELDNIDE